MIFLLRKNSEILHFSEELDGEEDESRSIVLLVDEYFLDSYSDDLRLDETEMETEVVPDEVALRILVGGDELLAETVEVVVWLDGSMLHLGDLRNHPDDEVGVVGS